MDAQPDLAGALRRLPRSLPVARVFCSMRLVGPAVAALLALWMSGVACAAYHRDPGQTSGWREAPPRLIAHGGGAFDGVTVTNSLQALDRSAAEEFLLIEVDFCWTTDGHLVLLHDWHGAFAAMFGLEPGPRSRDEFMGLTATMGLQQLGLGELATWLAQHPRVGLVTDIKTDRLRGLEVLAQGLEAVQAQVVPQVHDVTEGRRARDLGFEAIIFTIYTSPLSDDELFAVAQEEGFYAVTMPRVRAEAGLARQLSDVGVTTYAHTVNNHLLATRLGHAGVHGFYTDWLTPARSRRDAVATSDDWVIEVSPPTDVDGTGAAARSVLVVDLWESLSPRCGSLMVRRNGEGAPGGDSDSDSDSDDGSDGGGMGNRSVLLEAFSAEGTRMARLEVVPGPQLIPLASLFPEALPAWLAAPGDVALELHWDLLDRPVLVRDSTTQRLSASWHARGPVAGLGGVAVFMLNPGAEARSVEWAVREAGKKTRTVTRQLGAGALLTELVPLDGAPGVLDLSVSGDGVVVQLVRAAPEFSFVR